MGEDLPRVDGLDYGAACEQRETRNFAEFGAKRLAARERSENERKRQNQRDSEQSLKHVASRKQRCNTELQIRKQAHLSADAKNCRICSIGRLRKRKERVLLMNIVADRYRFPRQIKINALYCIRY